MSAQQPPEGASADAPESTDYRRHDRQEGWAVPIDRIEAFTSGAAMAVEVGQIEKELASLWRQAAERAQQAGTQLAVVRACLWNFAVFVSGEDELIRVKPVLDQVAEVVPARMIVLCATDPDEGGLIADDAPVRAYVEANIRPGPGGRREVVSEEITLEARSLETRRLPALLRSLILPDLPTAFFLSSPLGPGVGSGLRAIALEADRLVLDTGRLSTRAELHEMGASLLALLDAGPRSIEVIDLAWLRLLPWRSLVASLFDEEPAQRALAALDEVRIEYTPGAVSAALLLAGWLASRLGFTVPADAAGAKAVDLGQPITVRDRGGRAVRIVLSCVDEQHTSAGLTGVRLQAGERTFQARQEGGERARAEASGAPSQRTPLPPLRMHERSESELLIMALGTYGRDPYMVAALRAALGLLGRLAGADGPPA